MFDPDRIGRKKNEQIVRAVAGIERLKMQFALPYSALLKEVNFSYASFMRWKSRIASGMLPVEAPGAKKIEPFDISQLSRQIESLRHGKKRTHGTGTLHRAYRSSLSRRELNAMVGAVRKNCNRHRVAAQSRVIWHRPDLAWALDGSEYNGGYRCKLHVQNLQDLCSRYKFPPLATRYLPCGEEVAGHLDHHFSRFGPPLFFKRDNGGNLNHLSINQLLDQAMVIPINSPVNLAPYNGAIEHSQGELKGYLRKWKDKAGSLEELFLLAETAAHDLNHKPRRSLGGNNACRSYFAKDRIRYSKRKRKAVYQWIKDLAMDLSEAAAKNTITPVAWRLAAKKWLVDNKMITIVKAGKVLPYSSSDLCHN